MKLYDKVLIRLDIFVTAVESETQTVPIQYSFYCFTDVIVLVSYDNLNHSTISAEM